MRLEQVVAVTHDQTRGTITLEGIGADRLILIGSTMPASVSNGNSVNSFTITPNRNEVGVVAVHVHTDRYGNKKYGTSLGFLVPVKYENEVLHLDDKNVFAPDRDHCGQVVDNHLELIIDGQIFTTNTYGHDREPKKVFLQDPDLACRFIAGLATKEEVKAAASEYVEEQSAREQLKEIDNQIQLLEKQFQVIEGGKSTSERIEVIKKSWVEFRDLSLRTIQTKEQALQTDDQEIGRLRKENDRLKVLLKTWFNYATDLYRRLGGKLFKGKLLTKWRCQYPHGIWKETVDKMENVPEQS